MDIDEFAQVLERDFRAAANLPDNVPISVTWTEEETIVVLAGRERYIHTIGSDDESFHFVRQIEEHPSRPVVEFEFSPDWLALQGQG